LSIRCEFGPGLWYLLGHLHERRHERWRDRPRLARRWWKPLERRFMRSSTKQP